MANPVDFDYISGILKDLQTKEINDEKYSEVINKYGDGFTANYGWTKSAIGDKNNRNLGYIAKELGFDDKTTALYRITSSFIHTSSFTLFKKDFLNDVKINALLPMTVDMFVDQIIIYAKIMCKDKKESEFINVLVNGLQTETFLN